MAPILACIARLAALFLLFAHLPAQTCFHFGSVPVPASFDQGPALGCPGAPLAPAWQLWTPAHRAPAPHFGFRPGDASERSRWLLTYRCTGLWLFPVVPHRLRTMGYVIDQPEEPCGG
ncbi:MAG: hypothetical protein JNK49_06555 [Planctomycetes bacterium]|nr:hypothetical protein [Planctomycetota bacterium]